MCEIYSDCRIMVIGMRLARLVSIVMLLLQKERISATKLAEIFEVSPRSIYRDIEAINEAGIPIVTFPGVHGGISIMDEYKVKTGLFTMADIASLLRGLSSVPVTDEEVRNSIAKIRGLVPPEHMQEIEAKSHQISVDYTNWHGARTLPPQLEALRTAIDQNRTVFFLYNDPSGLDTERIIEPHRILLKENHWYLQAYCRQQEEFMTFSVSRMSTIGILNERFSPREFDQKPLTDADRPPPKFFITLLADKSLYGWMVDFCGEEYVSAREDGKLIVRFPFMGADYSYGIILRFGNKVECLEPIEVRKEVKKRAAEILDLYL